jgi:uncharacterized GH25 family protein
MTMTQKTVLGLALFITGAYWAQDAMAHFIWIEAPSEMSRDREPFVSLYFGEYQESIREEAGARLDKMDGAKAWVIDPKGNRLSLSLEKRGNRFVAVPKSPCPPGLYQVVAEHTEIEVQDLTKQDLGIVKPFYHARAQFLCADDRGIGEREKETDQTASLDILPLNKGINLAKGEITTGLGTEVAVKAIYQGHPLPSKSFMVHSPLGWSKEIKTDSQGIASFLPLWPGRYVFELLHLEKTPGEFKGKSYHAVRYRASLTLDVSGERNVTEK